MIIQFNFYLKNAWKKAEGVKDKEEHNNTLILQLGYFSNSVTGWGIQFLAIN